MSDMEKDSLGFQMSKNSEWDNVKMPTFADTHVRVNGKDFQVGIGPKEKRHLNIDTNAGAVYIRDINVNRTTDLISEMVKKKYNKLISKNDIMDVIIASADKQTRDIAREEVAVGNYFPVIIKDVDDLFSKAKNEYKTFKDVSEMIASEYELAKLEVRISNDAIDIKVSGENLDEEELDDIIIRYNHLSLVTPVLGKSRKDIEIEVIV